MNADAFRHLYGYHFSMNRVVWEGSLALPDEAFARESTYSHGSVRDQVLHLISTDDAWFSDLCGDSQREPPWAAAMGERDAIQTWRDEVDARMQDYLASLRDDMLDTTPLTGEDALLRLWQVLIHVVNHGTDHRAQVLRQINDLGVETTWQDYVFYAYEHPLA